MQNNMENQKKQTVSFKEKLRKSRRKLFQRKGFGLNEVLGIAAAVIIAAAIVIPGLKGFAENLMGDMTDWWATHTAEIFSTIEPSG